MKQHLVSVIIPAYNNGLLLIDTLKSVINQTYSDIEILVIDDGSEENLLEIINNMADERISYFKLPHTNANIARNYGISKSQGKYIAMLDSDDIWLPDHVLDCTETIEAHNADGLYGSLIVKQGEQKHVVTARYPFENETFIDYLLKAGYGAQTSTLFLKEEAIKKIMWDSTLLRHQDYDFVLRFYSQYNMVVKENPTVIYNVFASNKNIHFPSCIKFIERNRKLINPIIYHNYCSNMFSLARTLCANEDIKQYYIKESIRYKAYITYKDCLISIHLDSRLKRIIFKLKYIISILMTNDDNITY